MGIKSHLSPWLQVELIFVGLGAPKAWLCDQSCFIPVKQGLSTSQPGIRNHRGPVDGKWRVVADSPGERYFYFLLLLFLFPNYNNSPSALCLARGVGEWTDAFENPHCKDGSLNCGCSYFRGKFPWTIVLMMLRMIPWCVENSGNFIPHSASTPQARLRREAGKRLRHSGELSPEKRERNQGKASVWLRECWSLALRSLLKWQPEDFRVYCQKHRDKLEKVSFSFTKCLYLYECNLAFVSLLGVKKVKLLPPPYPWQLWAYSLLLAVQPSSAEVMSLSDISVATTMVLLLTLINVFLASQCCSASYALFKEQAIQSPFWDQPLLRGRKDGETVGSCNDCF